MKPLDEQSERYLIAHVREALAAEENELGIEVAVAGDTLVLTGTVATPARRDAVAAVAGRVADGHRVRNDVEVADLSEPSGREEVS